MIFSRSLDSIAATKATLRTSYEIQDGGTAQYILGIPIEQTGNGINLDQHGYLERTLTKFEKFISKIRKPIPVSVDRSIKDPTDTIELETAQSIVGTLNYFARLTRPDINFAVNYLSRLQLSASATIPAQGFHETLTLTNPILFPPLSGTNPR